METKKIDIMMILLAVLIAMGTVLIVMSTMIINDVSVLKTTIWNDISTPVVME